MEGDDETHHADDENSTDVTDASDASDATATYEADRDESAPQAVIAAVSSELDCAPTELRPLNAVVDPDALEALFQSTDTGQRGGHVAFTYAERPVTVRSDGLVRVGTRD